MTFLPQKVLTFSRALVCLRLFVWIIRVPFAGASISKSEDPQIAAICFCGQNTFIFRNDTVSSSAFTTRYEPVGDRNGSFDGAVVGFRRGSVVRE